MREAHAHILQTGRAMSMADLSACASAEEMLEALAAHSASLGPDTWVLAHGARPESWDNPRWPSREALDRACTHRPVAAWCFDYHALAASTAALKHAQIDKDTQIERGSVERGPDGEPTGLVLEHAALRVWDAVPEPSGAERHDLVRRACVHLAGLGFTEVHDLKAQPWLGAVLSDLLSAGEIDQRFVLFPLMDDLDGTAQRSGTWHGRVTLGGGKIFTDGTLNSRTAWVLRPWADAPGDRPLGTPMMSPREIRGAIEHARSHGLPIAAHAIGDGAVRAVLDAVEQTGASHTGVRIEHAELIDEADVPRFARLGVIASVQPCHLLADIEALGRACPDRLDRVLPLRDLIQAGLTPGGSLLFGSDVPIVRADPDDSIAAATQRRRPDMNERDAIGFEQRLTEDEARACFG